MQSVWQTYVDNGVSKTVNVPNSFDVKGVGDILNAAFEMNCKGVTIYRNGCKQGQPI
jgi:ribonucleoside-diphosphate reductase alpha chain